jgi:nucleoside-diphosphate-sugar epimerase
MRDGAPCSPPIQPVRPWDAVVDVAGVIPRLVERCARALAPMADRYIFLSTISTYRDWPYKPVDETSPLWDADPDYDPGTRGWDPDAYGPLKVGSELAAAREFGADRLLVLRPHVVLGPREYVGRLPWWLTRVQRGGPVVVPAPDRSIQPVDVRDLAVLLSIESKPMMSASTTWPLPLDGRLSAAYWTPAAMPPVGTHRPCGSTSSGSSTRA